MEGDVVNVLNEKPVFTVDFEARSLSFKVVINGVSLFDEYYHGGSMALTLPANHYFHPENNQVGFMVAPLDESGRFNAGALLKVSLNVHPQGEQESKITILSMTFKSDSDAEQGYTLEHSESGGYHFNNGRLIAGGEDVTVSDPIVEAEGSYEGAKVIYRNVNAPNSLPLWAFFNSDVLPDYYAASDEDYYAARDSLLEAHKVIHRGIESNDIDSIIHLFDERNRETDQAFYFEKGTTEAGIRGDLERAASNESLTLVPLVPDHVGVVQELNRKIVSLDRENFAPAIMLLRDEGGAAVYALHFRREGGEWILTR